MALLSLTSRSNLFVKAVVSSFRRSLVWQRNHTNILKIRNVGDKKGAHFYLGKRVAYIYKGRTLKQGTKFRVIWGKIVATHGSNGGVRAKFAKNLPPQALGRTVRVMLYPSNI